MKESTGEKKIDKRKTKESVSKRRNMRREADNKEVQEKKNVISNKRLKGKCKTEEEREFFNHSKEKKKKDNIFRITSQRVKTHKRVKVAPRQ